MQIRAKRTDIDYTARWNFSIDPKADGENNIEFGERFLKELGIASLRMVDLKEDTDRYKAEVDALTPPASDVPDDILITGE